MSLNKIRSYEKVKDELRKITFKLKFSGHSTHKETCLCVKFQIEIWRFDLLLLYHSVSENSSKMCISLIRMPKGPYSFEAFHTSLGSTWCT